MLNQFFSFKFLKVLFDQNKTIDTYVTDNTKTKIQRKTAGTTYTGGVYPGVVATNLTFNNLEAGKWYRASGMLSLERTNNTSGTSARVYISGVAEEKLVGGQRADNLTGQHIINHYFSHRFQAQSNGQLTFLVTGGAANAILGTDSFVDLEELPNHEQTTQWT